MQTCVIIPTPHAVEKQSPRLCVWLREAAFLLALGMIPLLWFHGVEIATGGDVVFPLDPLEWFRYRTSMWDYRVNAGAAASVHATTLSFHAIQAFLAWVGFPLAWVQRLSYVFWNCAICGSIYLLLRVINRNPTSPLSRWIGVGIFAFNPFLFNTWESGKASILSAFVALPCILALLIGMLQRNWPLTPSLAGVALVALLTGSIGADPPIIVVLFVAITLTTLILGRAQPAKGDLELKGRIKPGWIWVLTISVWGITSASWLLPYAWELWLATTQAQGQGLAVFHLADWLKGISTHTSLFNVARLQGAWDWYYTWNTEPYISYAARYFSNPLLIALSLFWPLAAYSALMVRRDRTTWLFVLLGLVGTLGAAGLHPPTGGIFLWLAEHLPGFFVFRSPYYKFGILIPLAYAVLVPQTWEALAQRLQARFRSHAWIKPTLASVFIAANAVYAAPLLTGEIIYTHEKMASIRLTVPPHIQETAQWLSQQPTQGRVLSLPQDVTDMYTWKYGSLAHLLTLAGDRPVLHGTGDLDPVGKLRNLCYAALYKTTTPFVTELLDLLGVRYLLLRNDSWFDFSGDTDSPKFVAERLGRQIGVQSPLHYGPWSIYGLAQPRRPPVRIASELSLVIGSDQALVPLSYPRPEHDTNALFLLNNDSQRELARHLLERNDGIRLIFHDTSSVDLALELVAPTARVKMDESQKGWVLDLDRSGLYELWLAWPRSQRPSPFSGLLIDKEELSLPATTQKVQGLTAFQWTRWTPKTFGIGRHVLRPLDLQPGTSLPTLVAFPAEQLLEWIFLVHQQIAKLSAPLTWIQTGTPHFQKVDPSPNEASLALIPFGLFPPEAIEGQGTDWQWLTTDARYVLINWALAPVRVPLQFEAYTPLADRTLYVILDGQLLRHLRIRAGEVTPLFFEEVELTPGEHRLSLYVLEGTFSLRQRPTENPGRLVTIAVRYFSVGPSLVQAEFPVPRAGEYQVTAYPFPMGRYPHADVPLTLFLQDRPIAMVPQNAPGSSATWWVSEDSLTLAPGSVELHLQGRPSENYFIQLEEKSGGASGVSAPDIHWSHPDPATYTATVSVKEQEGPWYLVVQDAYHAGWEARIGNKSEKNLLITEHFQADGYANAWSVGLQGTQRLQIFYKPQHLFWLGCSISVACVAFCAVMAAALWAIGRMRRR